MVSKMSLTGVQNGVNNWKLKTGERWKHFTAEFRGVQRRVAQRKNRSQWMNAPMSAFIHWLMLYFRAFSCFSWLRIRISLCLCVSVVKWLCTGLSPATAGSRMLFAKLKSVMLNSYLKSPGCWTGIDGIVFRQCPECPKWVSPRLR